MIKEKKSNISFQKCKVCGVSLLECTCKTMINTELDSQTGGNIEDLTSTASLTGRHKPGKIFEGRYTVKKVIGVGGMGTVYEARHLALENRVAIKTLRTELIDESKIMARFEQEARSCAVLAHPNIVNVIDCGISEDAEPFLVMEYLEGPHLLDDVRANGNLDLNKFFEVFLQTCSSLEYAHSQGVIHRDLKPGNIIITRGPEDSRITKLVDFGIAKIEDLGGNIQMLTQTGEVMGSPSYMSPEQCAGEKVDHRVDIYALGCLMYESISGKQAFSGYNIMEVLEKQLNETPEDIDEIVRLAKAPVELADVIKKCLEKNPDDRYASCAELYESLKIIKENMLVSESVELAGKRIKLETLAAALLAVAIGLCLLNFKNLIPQEIVNRITGQQEQEQEKKDFSKKAENTLARSLFAMYGGEHEDRKSVNRLISNLEKLKKEGVEDRTIVVFSMAIINSYHDMSAYQDGIDYFEQNKELLKNFEFKLKETEKKRGSFEDNLSADSLSLAYLYAARCYNSVPVNKSNRNLRDLYLKKSDELYLKSIEVAKEQNASKWVLASIIKYYLDFLSWTQKKNEDTIKWSNDLLVLVNTMPKLEQRNWLYDGHYIQAKAYAKMNDFENAEKNMVIATNISINQRNITQIRANFNLLKEWCKKSGQEKKAEFYDAEKKRALARNK